DRLWHRLEDPERPGIATPEANFRRWGELRAKLEGSAQLALRELELIGHAAAEGAPHIPSRPSMAFRGNVPVAVAEARSLVEQGNRVAFFARTMGELERLADIFREYSAPYQLGVEPGEQGAYLAERAYMSGATASTYLLKGAVRRGVIFPEARVALFW